MTKVSKIIIPILILIVVSFFYWNSNYYISKNSWKYRNGIHIGDWVNFNLDNMKRNGRKIYKNGESIAFIKICLGKLLIIQSNKTDDLGYYINK